MSVRGDILDTLATQLAAITVANGYNSNVEEVLRKVKHSEELPSADPYLTIIDNGPDEIRQYCDGNKVRAEMTVTILAQVRGTTGDTPPTAEVSQIIGDVRRLVASPVSLGSYVRFVEFGTIPAIFSLDQHGAAGIPLLISYWFDADSP